MEQMCIRDRTDALLVNPNDTEQIENAICRALEMPFEEQKERMQDVYKRQV